MGIADRIHNLYKGMSDYKLDALLITHPANVSYVCQYKIDDSCLLICPGQNFLITDFRYLEEAQSRIKGFSIKQQGGNKRNVSLPEEVSSIVKKLRIKRLGFEAKHLSFYAYQALADCLDKQSELTPVDDLIEKYRLIKDKEEIVKIESAVKLTVEAFIFLKKIIKPGIREMDVSAEVNRFIRLKGADGSSFEIIVASGRHSSMPHSQTSSKILRDNEPILVDMGVDFSGYKSDLTRMFFLGKMPRKVKEANEVVFAAKSKAIDLVKPGLAIKEADRAARSYIAKFGWSKNFGHSLGHGIGLEVHEEPAINHKNDSRLKAGMVFTIEPAVYFAGDFGVRLEDMIMVTEKGCRVLNVSLDKSM